MVEQIKPDAFYINDNLSLSFEEIKERALDIAADRAAENGWITYQLYQIGNPQRSEGVTRYNFTVVSSELGDDFSDNQFNSQVETPQVVRRVAISRDIGL